MAETDGTTDGGGIPTACTRNDHKSVQDVLKRHPLLLGRSQADVEHELLLIKNSFSTVDFDHPLNFGRLRKALKKMGARPVYDILCSDQGRAVVELSVEPFDVLSRDRFSSQNAPGSLVQVLFNASEVTMVEFCGCRNVAVAKVVAGYSLLWQLLASRSRWQGAVSTRCYVAHLQY